MPYGAVIDCVRNDAVANLNMNKTTYTDHSRPQRHSHSPRNYLQLRTSVIKTANLLQNSIPGMIVRQEGLLEPDYKGHGRLLIEYRRHV